MRYMIGIDGGGTKTERVLFDETGHILARDVRQGCNALDLGTKGIEIAEACGVLRVLRLLFYLRNSRKSAANTGDT